MTTDAQAHPPAPLVWAHVLGRGAIQLDDGHGVAVNSAGRVLVAARFDAPDEQWTELDELCDGGWTRSIVGEA